MSRLEGKTAVITGAARGIGRAIAVAYAREGAAIMGIDKATEVSPTTAYAATPADLAETQRLVEVEGARFIAVTLAICDLGAVGSGPGKRYPRYRKLLVGLRRQLF